MSVTPPLTWVWYVGRGILEDSPVAVAELQAQLDEKGEILIRRLPAHMEGKLVAGYFIERPGKVGE